jgi:alpha-L-rhamnosidase
MANFFIMKSIYSIFNLRCEYLKNPLGIDIVFPELSWEITAENQTEISQKSYCITVASSIALLEKGEPDFWDSGKVLSDQSIHVPYTGLPLPSRQRCYWKVNVELSDGSKLTSAPAFWSMGLLHPSDWNAQWIGFYQTPQYPEPWFGAAEWIWSGENRQAGTYAVRAHWFLCEFDVPPDLANVPVDLWAYGDDEGTIYLDNQEIAQATPVMIYPDSTPLFCLYTAPRRQRVSMGLSAGKHRLAVRGVNREGEKRPAGVILRLLLQKGNVRQEVVTNGTWQHLPEQNPLLEPPNVLTTGEKRLAFSLGAFGLPPWDQVNPREFRNLPARYLRQEIDLSSEGKHATIYISGLGHFELYINGHRVGDEVLVPNLTDYEKRVFYRTYDVSSLLHPGKNALGVILGNGWFFASRDRMPFQFITYDCPKMILQLEVENNDGSCATFISDSRWKIFMDGPLGWNNLFDGEVYDARKEMVGWSSPGFDDKNWQAVQMVVNPLGVLSAQMAEPQRVTEIITPVGNLNKSSNRRIYDLGENVAGWTQIEISGNTDTKIELRHAEKLDLEGELSMDNLRSAQCTDTLYLSDKTTTYEPRFVYHGFRYVEITSDPGPLPKHNLKGRVVHDDVRPTGFFNSSSPVLNQLFRNISRGLRGNYHNVPTDCPQRDERLGWLGDRGAGCTGEMYLFDVAALYRKWVQDFADAQTPSGLIPDIAPGYLRMQLDNVTWPSCITFVPMALYRHYGDTATIRRHYFTMQRWIDHMLGYMEGGLISRDNWGDWCVPPESPELILTNDPQRKTDGTILASSYFYKNLQNISFFAQLAGRPDDCKKYSAIASQLKESFNRVFFDPAKSQYGNGSQTSCVLALAMGLAPEKNQEAIFQRLLANLCTPQGPVLGVGLIGIQWLMRELTRRGRIDVAYAIATRTDYPSWGYMLKHGATTLWELWNGDTAQPFMNSGNHIMLTGDLHTWMFECLGGIRPDRERPGFKKIVFAPDFACALDSVTVTHDSMHGRIRSEWEKSDNSLRWNISIPVNTRAQIALGSLEQSTIQVGGKRIDTSIMDKTSLELGSGDYLITGNLSGK